MKIRFIGDVHGKVDTYSALISQDSLYSIQVGDFGFKLSHDWHRANIDGDWHKINFGNHDYLPYINKRYSLGDFSLWKGVFSIRGAKSIDRYRRKENYDWFSNEELDYATGLSCFDVYAKCRPSVVVSHDCPAYVRAYLFNVFDKSPTSNLLEACWQQHKPDTWVFGHWHKSIDVNIKGTRFICLAECEEKVLDV